MPESLTIREAAALKGVAYSTVHRAIREGRLKATAHIPEGAAVGVWHIRPDDLAAWVPAVSPADRGRIGAAKRYQMHPETR